MNWSRRKNVAYWSELWNTVHHRSWVFRLAAQNALLSFALPHKQAIFLPDILYLGCHGCFGTISDVLPLSGTWLMSYTRKTFECIHEMPRKLIVNSLTEVVFQQHTSPAIILISWCALDSDSGVCCGWVFSSLFCQCTDPGQLNLSWIPESINVFLPLAWAQSWCHSNHSNHWGELKGINTPPPWQALMVSGELDSEEDSTVAFLPSVHKSSFLIYTK